MVTVTATRNPITPHTRASHHGFAGDRRSPAPWSAQATPTSRRTRTQSRGANRLMMLSAPCRAGRWAQRLQVRHQVNQFLHGHRVVEGGHLRCAVWSRVSPAGVDEAAGVHDRLDEKPNRVMLTHRGQIRSQKFPLDRSRERLALDLVACVALELFEGGTPPARIPALGQRELPTFGITMWRWRPRGGGRARRRSRLGGAGRHRQQGSAPDSERDQDRRAHTFISAPAR